MVAVNVSSLQFRRIDFRRGSVEQILREKTIRHDSNWN
jgi:hypothetical protein